MINMTIYFWKKFKIWFFSTTCKLVINLFFGKSFYRIFIYILPANQGERLIGMRKFKCLVIKISLLVTTLDLIQKSILMQMISSTFFHLPTFFELAFTSGSAVFFFLSKILIKYLSKFQRFHLKCKTHAKWIRLTVFDTNSFLRKII